MATGINYRPDIDGLRAVSILLVLLYHLESFVEGGYVGVDVFFVISGYLITSILCHEAADGSYSLGNFYERRARRILPALFASVIASSIAALFLLFPNELQIFAKSAVSALSFSANFFFWLQAGYFEAPAESMPLLHTWSLAVEEQFYLLFPLILIPLLRRRPGFALPIVVVIAIASLALSQFLVASKPDTAFYMLAPRAWELMTGAGLALVRIPAIASKRVRDLVASGALLSIVMVALLYDKQTSFPGLTALAPCLGAALLIYTGQSRDTQVYRLLSWRPLVALGLISYSLYLWHVPIITFVSAYFGNPLALSTKILLIPICILVAFASWRYIEQPFRRREGGFDRTKLVQTSAAAAVVILAIAAVSIYTLGLPQRFDPEVLRFAEFNYKVGNAQRSGQCFISRGGERTGKEFDFETCLAMDDRRPDVLVIGDSHAAHLWPGLKEVYPGINFLQANVTGCTVDLVQTGSERCKRIMRRVLDDHIAHKKLDAVILSIRWKSPDIEEAAHSTLAKLKASTPHVYVIGPIMSYNTHLPRLLTRAAQLSDDRIVERALRRDPFEIDNRFKAAFAGAGVTYVSLIDLLCPLGECQTLDSDNLPLQHDSNHLTAGGSRLVAEKLATSLKFSLNE